MNTPLLLSSFILFFVSQFPAQANFDQKTSVRTLLTKTTRITLEANQLEAQASLGKWETFESPLIIKYVNGDILLNNISLLGDSDYVAIKANGSPITYNKRHYPGWFIIKKEMNRFSVINYTNLYHYLQGVLHKEMNSAWPVSALQAQAVASRSYFLHRKKRSQKREYDVVATYMDQVYQGLPIKKSKRIQKAVKTTDGETLQYRKNLMKTYFHANCGGHTTTPKKVWTQANHKEQASMASVKCEYCHKHPFEWSAHVTKDRIVKKLTGKKGKLHQSWMQLYPNESRVKNFEIVTDTKDKRTFTTENLRKRLGYSTLKSNDFQYTSKSGSLFFSGKGYGHGVGMCQWGARHLALRGSSYQKILKHYYPKGKILKKKS